MTNQIATWAEFRTDIKEEGKLLDAAEDALLLALANEILVEACASTENLRDFRFNVTTSITNAGYVDFVGAYIREIEQVFFIRVIATIAKSRWAIPEQTGMVCPSPFSGLPDCYVVRATPTVGPPPVPTYRFEFPALDVNANGHKLQVIGSGFKFILNDADTMPYVSFYPMLKRSILQRVQMKRSTNVDLIKVWDGPVARGAAAASIGEKDDGNDLTTEK